MADQKMYQAPGVDLQHLGQSLGQWYTGKGYKTQVMEGPGGAIVVQATKGTGLITTATSQALTVTLTSQGDNLFVQTGGARWAEKAVSGVVGLIVFWPLAALPAYGAYKQKEIIDETYQFIEQYLVSGGQMPAAMTMAAPMMGTGMGMAPAPAPAGGAHCPSCGQSVRAGAKFCEKCGASMAAPTCAKCGATLSPGAKFCAGCGAKA
jgi:hypothetical protein